jgi:alpha-tubulin suppressor-like RCC1 family protein
MAGELGSSPFHDTPVAISGLASGTTAITGGEVHECALVGGGIKCLGDNNAGELGNNSRISNPLPVAVYNLTNVAQLSHGASSHQCAITSGDLWCWGQNQYGETGATTTGCGLSCASLVPVMVHWP